MFLRIAKSKQPLWVFFIPIVGIALWLKSLMGHVMVQSDYTEHTMPLFNLIIHSIGTTSIISKTIALALVFILAFMLNRLNTKFIFLPERTYLPAIFYILFVSIYAHAQVLSPTLPAAILILFAIERILDSYKSEQLSYNIFEAAFLIGLASMIYFNAIFFLAFIWFALVTVRPFYLREWIYSFLGIFFPYFILFSVYFLADWPINQLIILFKNNFIWEIATDLSTIDYAIFGYSLLLIVIASIYMITIYQSKKVLTRRAYNLFLNIFLLSAAIFTFVPSASYELIYIAAIPVSMLVSHFFVSVRPGRWNILLFDLFIGLLIAIQFIS